MALTSEFFEYVKEKYYVLNNISFRKMMGEYLIYYNNVLIGGIYDNRLLIKKTITNLDYHFKEEIPYPSGKPMYYFEDIENADLLINIIIVTYKGIVKNK